MVKNDPKNLRKVYFDAWQKALNHQVLSPMETFIVDIIERHPEYQPIFNDVNDFENFQSEKYTLDHNPFFHLALHVTLCEQVGADRPKGIQPLFHQLLKKYDDKTVAEHKMIACLARVLVEGFKNEQDVNDQLYLEMVKKLL